MRVADYLMTQLVEAGVHDVFLLAGGGAMHLNDAAGKAPGLRYVANHHEQACTIAAEAYARVTGNIGAALVTSGPGATNAITGVVGAWIESVPLIVISGQVKRADLKRERAVRQMGVQEVDIVSLVRHVTKYAVVIEDPDSVRYEFEKAMHLARHGRKGPVWLDVPLDVQAATVDPATLRGFVPPEDNRAERSHALARQASRILELIRAAQRPLILAGHGIRLAGAAAAFERLYEQLRIPVVTTWNAMDLIPHAHPLAVGKPGVVALRAPNFAVQNCDLLIVIGCRLDNVVTAFAPKSLARAATKIVIDVDTGELDKHEVSPLIKIHADAKDAIDELLRQAPATDQPREHWLKQCTRWKERYTVCDGKPFPSSGPISHYLLADALSAAIPDGNLIVTGSSGLGVEAFYTGFRNRPGQRVFLTSGLGAMGYGLPAAIGACIAAGRRRTICVEGDGSLQLNIQELATVRGLNLPIILFVMNNNGYASIRNTQRNYFESRFVGTGPESNLYFPDIQEVAKAYGIPSSRITDASDLNEGLRFAMLQPGPFICEVKLIENEVLWPKVAAIPQPDGTMISMPLEDMSPLLPREEFRANMLVELSKESDSVSDG